MNEVWHARSGIVTRGRASADVPCCAVRPRMAVPVILHPGGLDALAALAA